MAQTISVVRYPQPNGAVHVLRIRQDRNGKVYYERFCATGAGRYVRITAEKAAEYRS